MKQSKKTAVVIGFGSIGKRHYKVLKKLNYFQKIFILSNQNLSIKNQIKKMDELSKINPDYFVICSETFKHYEQLNYINNNFKNKKILVEKPIYEKFYNLKIKNKNKVYVAYNFRFHPIIKKIKNLCVKEKIYFIKVFCGSYLPSWRPNRSYRKTYSAIKKKGGGVLLDLSHEIDYINWIFGKIKIKYKIYKKISNLKTTSKDYVNILGYLNKKNYVEISLNYFSKIPKRQIMIDGKNLSIFADLIENKMIINKKNKIKILSFSKNSLDASYLLEHKNILFEKRDIICEYNDALKITKFLDKINN